MSFSYKIYHIHISFMLSWEIIWNYPLWSIVDISFYLIFLTLTLSYSGKKKDNWEDFIHEEDKEEGKDEEGEGAERGGNVGRVGEQGRGINMAL